MPLSPNQPYWVDQCRHCGVSLYYFPDSDEYRWSTRGGLDCLHHGYRFVEEKEDDDE